MEKFLKFSWWALALRGISAILFGLLAMIWPGLTIEVLILFFGSYAIVDGLFSSAASVIHRKHDSTWWFYLLAGLAGVAAGILTLILPGLTALALVYFIAARAVVVGLIEIYYGIALRRETRTEWYYIVNGLFSIIFGGILFILPGVGALSLIIVIGAFALVIGFLLLVQAFRLRKLNQSSQPHQ